jgi:transcriptional regulator with XRE-family HTH domain
MSSLKKNLAVNVRRLRKSMGLSQTALGKKAQMNPSTISFIENAATFPHLENLKALAKVFGVSDFALVSPPHTITDDNSPLAESRAGYGPRSKDYVLTIKITPTIHLCVTHDASDTEQMLVIKLKNDIKKILERAGADF